MKQSLKERLVRYFEKNKGVWIPSGHIQRIAAEKTSYTPSNVSRRLREIQNEGIIQVEYRSDRGVQHAYYKAP